MPKRELDTSEKRTPQTLSAEQLQVGHEHPSFYNHCGSNAFQTAVADGLGGRPFTATLRFRIHPKRKLSYENTKSWIVDNRLKKELHNVVVGLVGFATRERVVKVLLAMVLQKSCCAQEGV